MEERKLNLDRLKEPFPEDCIEWRISQAGKQANGQPWAQVLAYVEARAGQDRLDEVFSPLGWRVVYEFVDDKYENGTDSETGKVKTVKTRTGGVLAHIEVYCDKKNEWVRKTDGAEQTDFEPFKGGLSGAFKRAVSLWGVGRYLYGLESGFAQIVDKGAPGAKYNKSKTKNGEEVSFYWVPPRLPAWALPKKENAK